MSGNAWTNRNPQQISRTGVDKSIPISTPIHSGKSKSSSPDSSGVTGTKGNRTRNPIVNTDPPCGLNVIPKNDNIRQSTTPDLRKSNKLDTSIYGKFTNNLVVLPIFTEVICDKLSYSLSQDLYTCCRMNLTACPINILAQKFVYLDISTIDALVSGPLLPELELLWISPIGVQRIIFLKNTVG